jgi:hypothetical protein
LTFSNTIAAHFRSALWGAIVVKAAIINCTTPWLTVAAVLAQPTDDVTATIDLSTEAVSVES